MLRHLRSRRNCDLTKSTPDLKLAFDECPRPPSAASAQTNGSISALSSHAGVNMDDASVPEGPVLLDIVLPGGKQVTMQVDALTPMMDLLVQVTSRNGISPGGLVLRVPSDRPPGYVSYKPSTPVGRLGPQLIQVVPKSDVVDGAYKRKSQSGSHLPFEPTSRVQVDLPRGQKTTVRVKQSILLSVLLEKICLEQGLNSSKFVLRAADRPEQPLDNGLKLSEAGTTRFTLVSVVINDISKSTDDILSYMAKMPFEEKQQHKRKGFFGLFQRSNKRKQAEQPEQPNQSSQKRAPLAPTQPVVEENHQSPTDPTPPDALQNDQKGSRKKRQAPKPPPTETSFNEPEPLRSTESSEHTIVHIRETSGESSGFHDRSTPSHSPVSNATQSGMSSGTSSLDKKRGRAPKPPPSPPASVPQEETQDGVTPKGAQSDRDSAVVALPTDIVMESNGKESPDNEPTAVTSNEDVTAHQRVTFVASAEVEPTQSADDPVSAQNQPHSETDPIEPDSKVQPCHPTDESPCELPFQEDTPHPSDMTTSRPLNVDDEPVVVAERSVERMSFTSVVTVNIPSAPAPPQPSPSPPVPSPPPLEQQPEETSENGWQRVSVADSKSDSERSGGRSSNDPSPQRRSNIVLQDPKKDKFPSMRVMSFEEEYYSAHTEDQYLSSVRYGLENGDEANKVAGKDDRLTGEYDKLQKMFDDWQQMVADHEQMVERGRKVPEFKIRQLQRVQECLVEQHELVQSLCVSAQQPMPATQLLPARPGSAMSQQSSSLSSLSTPTSRTSSPVKSNDKEEEEKFWPKETAAILQQSKRPNAKVEEQAGYVHAAPHLKQVDRSRHSGATVIELRDKRQQEQNDAYKRPSESSVDSSSVVRPSDMRKGGAQTKIGNGTMELKKRPTKDNSKVVREAFKRQSTTEELVDTSGVVKPSMLFGARKSSDLSVSVVPTRRTSNVVSPMAKTVAASPVLKSSPVQAKKVIVQPKPDNKPEQEAKIAPKHAVYSFSAKTTAKVPESLPAAKATSHTLPRATSSSTRPLSPAKARPSSPVVGKTWPTAPAQPSTPSKSWVATTGRQSPVSPNPPIKSAPPPTQVPTPPPFVKSEEIQHRPLKTVSTPPPSQMVNGSASAPNLQTKSVTPSIPNAPPPPPAPPLDAAELVAQMQTVKLKPAAQRQMKPKPTAKPVQKDQKADLMASIRTFGGSKGLKKVHSN